MRWSDWVHVMTSTRGHWLPGDPRGFRNRAHRIHSSGDYRNPPPRGEHAGLHAHARAISKGCVRLRPDHARVVGAAMVDKLESIPVLISAFALDAVHAHALLRVGHANATAVFGRAKQAGSHAVWNELPGGIWGRSSHVVRIRSLEHGATVREYILGHASRGAWTFDPKGRRH